VFRTQAIFQITPLNWVEWQMVIYLSAPVVLLDEMLKIISVSAVVVLFCAKLIMRRLGNVRRSPIKSEVRVRAGIELGTIT